MLRYLVGRIERHPNGRKPESHILRPLVSGTVEASCHTERGCVSRFKTLSGLISSLEVVNDAGERGVKLIQVTLNLNVFGGED